MSQPILRVENLTKRWGGLAATNNVTFDIQPGELVAIIGPNGAGKTTLINLVTGVYKPSSGRIFFEQDDVTTLSVHTRSLRGLARSFQITSIFPELTALENVAIAAQAHRGHSFRFWKAIKRDRGLFDASFAILRDLRIGDKAQEPASRLAHGEKRILEIAMALVTYPKMLLLDEPMAGLGREESREMIQFVSTMKRRSTILLVEHDMEAVFSLADRIVVLASGEIVASGTPAEIKVDPNVKLVYLGDDANA